MGCGGWRAACKPVGARGPEAGGVRKRRQAAAAGGEGVQLATGALLAWG